MELHKVWWVTNGCAIYTCIISIQKFCSNILPSNLWNWPVRSGVLHNIGFLVSNPGFYGNFKRSLLDNRPCLLLLDKTNNRRVKANTSTCFDFPYHLALQVWTWHGAFTVHWTTPVVFCRFLQGHLAPNRTDGIFFSELFGCIIYEILYSLKSSSAKTYTIDIKKHSSRMHTPMHQL